MNSRDKLQIIIKSSTDRREVTDKILTDFPNILFVENIPTTSFNCFMYALQKLGFNPRNLERITSLRKLNDKIPIHESSTNGNLAIYTDGDKIVHYGIALPENKIVSRWGELPVFQHKPMDVPSSYGNNIFYCNAQEYVEKFTLRK